MRRRVASKQVSCRMREDIFNTIDYISKTEDRNKIYLEPNFKSVPWKTMDWVPRGKYG